MRFDVSIDNPFESLPMISRPAPRFASTRLLRCLGVILSITLFASFTNATERESLKLLAIGNSFSNDATAFLPDLAKAGQKKLVIGRASIGGCSLERHARHLSEAEAKDPAGRAYKDFIDPHTGQKRPVTLIEALEADAWEVVTLQQVSTGSFKKETFQPYLDQLIAAVRKYAPTAEIVIHQTWAYREDHAFFQNNDDFTPLKMYEELTANYRGFADQKGFRVLPVGDALHLARQTPRWSYTPDSAFDFKNPPAGKLPDQRTSLNVGWHWAKNKDGEPFLALDAIHCNAAGKYLGASVWYLELFQADSLPADYTPERLAPEDAADLRGHALAAVKAERARAAELASAKQ
jgi:hypothetical protein